MNKWWHKCVVILYTNENELATHGYHKNDERRSQTHRNILHTIQKPEKLMIIEVGRGKEK